MAGTFNSACSRNFCVCNTERFISVQGHAFGMKNAPATFQRMVNKLVRDIDGCEGYIDDVVIFSDNWSDHIRQIERFFQIMREAKLTINLMKSEFGKATVKYLGHIVGQGQVRPLDAKIQTIVKYPIPTS